MEMTRRLFLQALFGAGAAAAVVLSTAGRLLAAIQRQRENPDDGRDEEGFRWELPDEEVTGGQGLPRVDERSM